MGNSILELVLSGGIASALLAIFTLRSKVRKAQAETQRLELENSDKATEILMENIVVPLKQELHETRNEITLLREAIVSARTCSYVSSCPVIAKLQEPQAPCPAYSKGIFNNSSSEGEGGKS